MPPGKNNTEEKRREEREKLLATSFSGLAFLSQISLTLHVAGLMMSIPMIELIDDDFIRGVILPTPPAKREIEQEEPESGEEAEPMGLLVFACAYPPSMEGSENRLAQIFLKRYQQRRDILDQLSAGPRPSDGYSQIAKETGRKIIEIIENGFEQGLIDEELESHLRVPRGGRWRNLGRIRASFWEKIKVQLDGISIQDCQTAVTEHIVYPDEKHFRMLTIVCEDKAGNRCLLDSFVAVPIQEE
jgi:hypothetical protein